MALLLSAIVVAAALAFTSHHYWLRLFETGGAAAQRDFLWWTGKGLVVPLIFWLIINCGFMPGMPILLPEIALAKSRGGNWATILAESCGPVLLITGSFWSAITFAWLQDVIAHRANDRREFKSLFIFWTLLLGPVAGLIFYALGPGGFGFALLVWFVPTVHASLPLIEQRSILLTYSRAIARMKFGKYRDAELEILQELEKREDDYDGWMMLAELYANHFNDLPEADRAIRELCGQPNVTGIQISLALHRLADWHLKRGADPQSARSALEEIRVRLPGTHFARMAQLRIEQLPASREELLEQRKPKTFRLPALGDALDQTRDAQTAGVDPSEAKRLADQCVEKLRRNPNDVAAREKFARLLAEQLDRPELAIEQLELLLAMPDKPAQKSAEWLALIAAWTMQYQHDWKTARARLQQIIQLYPQSPQAFAAQRRLGLMEMEEKFRRARSRAQAE